MRSAMVKLTPGIVLAMPALVSATPIYVEYETRVMRCYEQSGPEPTGFCSIGDGGYQLGERVAGWLKIDTDRAPPNRFPDRPPRSQLRAEYWGTGSDFISGFGPPELPFSNDAVAVIDDSERYSFQGYAIFDYSQTRQADSTLLELQVYSEDRLHDFIHGTGLIQSLDTQNLKGDVKFAGRITQELKGMMRTFELALGRLSITPGRCRAP
jgi:hypothetical protein